MLNEVKIIHMRDHNNILRATVAYAHGPDIHGRDLTTNPLINYGATVVSPTDINRVSYKVARGIALGRQRNTKHRDVKWKTYSGGGLLPEDIDENLAPLSILKTHGLQMIGSMNEENFRKSIEVAKKLIKEL